MIEEVVTVGDFQKSVSFFRSAEMVSMMMMMMMYSACASAVEASFTSSLQKAHSPLTYVQFLYLLPLQDWNRSQSRSQSYIYCMMLFFSLHCISEMLWIYLTVPGLPAPLSYTFSYNLFFIVQSRSPHDFHFWSGYVSFSVWFVFFFSLSVSYSMKRASSMSVLPTSHEVSKLQTRCILLSSALFPPRCYRHIKFKHKSELRSMNFTSVKHDRHICLSCFPCSECFICPFICRCDVSSSSTCNILYGVGGDISCNTMNVKMFVTCWS